MQRITITVFTLDGATWRMFYDPLSWSIDDKGTLWIGTGAAGITTATIATTLPFAVETIYN